METTGDTMSRRHILVAYDISDERRVKRVQRVVGDVAERVQLSVYCGQFSRKDLVVLKERLRQVMNQRDDQVIFLDLGEVAERDDDAANLGMEVLGRGWQPKVRANLVF